MATLNKKVLINARLHKTLHRNVYLLGLCYPMSKDLIAQFKEGMFEKPNGAAFHHLSFYLMSIIDPKCNTTSSWAMFEIKMEAKYRTEFLKFVNNISKDHEGQVSRIVQSWIVNAGGFKVAKLMFELSQIALKLHILKVKGDLNLNINEVCMDDIYAKLEKLKDILTDKISRWRAYTTNMNEIFLLYQKISPIVHADMELKEIMLMDVVKKSFPENNDLRVEVSSVFLKSQFLTDWASCIDQGLNTLEANWDKKSVDIIDHAKKCRSRSEQLIRMHTNFRKNDMILEYNSSRDKLLLDPEYEGSLSVTQSSILKKNIRDGVMNLPNMFRSYSVIISNGFRSYEPCDSAVYLQNLEEKKQFVMYLKQKLCDFPLEAFKYYLELKEPLENEENSYTSIESSLGIYEVLNIPTISLKNNCRKDFSEYWQESLQQCKFREFKHAFKSKKMPYIFDSNALPKYDIDKVNHSFVKRSFSDIKLSQTSRMYARKPDYLKNIEEVKRNMEMMSDNLNRTHISHSTSVMSRLGTERKNPLFSNHMKYLLTSVKKKSGILPNKVPKIQINDQSFRNPKWGNLFDESRENLSVWHKTHSSPNLLEENYKTKYRSRINHKSSEFISGIKEIDYSSFIGDVESKSSVLNSAEKENIPNNQATVVTETLSIVNRMEFETIPVQPCQLAEVKQSNKVILTPSSRKSVELLINNFKKFKEARGLGLKKSVKQPESDSTSSAGSFLDRADLGHFKNQGKENATEVMDMSGLSSLPDLLSPSLDFNVHHSSKPK